MFVQSQLPTFSLVTLSQYFDCLYSLRILFFLWKEICDLPRFIDLYDGRIVFKMHFQIQPRNFSLVTPVKLHVYIYIYIYIYTCIYIHVYIYIYIYL